MPLGHFEMLCRESILRSYAGKSFCYGQEPSHFAARSRAGRANGFHQLTIRSVWLTKSADLLRLTPRVDLLRLTRGKVNGFVKVNAGARLLTLTDMVNAGT